MEIISESEIGIYNLENLKEINGCSDIEGYKFNPIVKCMEKVIKETNVGFFYTGDLQDHGPNNLFLIEKLIEMKTTSREKVILIGGNRDINKVRMGRDFHIVKSDGTSLLDEINTLKNTDDLVALSKKIATGFSQDPPEYKFLFTIKELNDNFLRVKYDDLSGNKIKIDNMGMTKKVDNTVISGNKTTEIVDEDSPDIVVRVQKLYKNTFGAESEFKDALRLVELADNIFFRKVVSNGKTKTNLVVRDADGSETIISENEKAVIICLLNMIMGNVWETNEHNGQLFTRLNGLYIKYINLCHIIALASFNNKNYVFSHSKMPKKLYSLGFCEDMFGQLMSRREDMLRQLTPPRENNIRRTHDINEIFRLVNKCTNILSIYTANKITQRSNLTNLYMETLRDTIDKLTMVTAVKGFRGNSCSPVVLTDPKSYAYNGKGFVHTQVQSGGYDELGFAPFQYKDDIVFFDFSESDIKIDFNIYGHHPQGIIPTIETLYQFARINIDVSKPYASLPDNDVYAIYNMEKGKEDKIIGSFKFSDPIPIDKEQSGVDAREKFKKDIKFNVSDINSVEIKIEDPARQITNKKKFINLLDGNYKQPIYKYYSTIDKFKKNILFIYFDDGVIIECKLIEYKLDKRNEILTKLAKDTNFDVSILLGYLSDMLFNDDLKVPSPLPGSLYILEENDSFFNKYFKYKKKYLELEEENAQLKEKHKQLKIRCGELETEGDI